MRTRTRYGNGLLHARLFSSLGSTHNTTLGGFVLAIHIFPLFLQYDFRTCCPIRFVYCSSCFFHILFTIPIFEILFFNGQCYHNVSCFSHNECSSPFFSDRLLNVLHTNIIPTPTPLFFALSLEWFTLFAFVIFSTPLSASRTGDD